MLSHHDVAITLSQADSGIITVAYTGNGARWSLSSRLKKNSKEFLANLFSHAGCIISKPTKTS